LKTRLGTTKDYIIIGSDSGKISILEYLPERNAFGKVHEETFGRSGARRIVPGQYLAVDPAGRATMIGAVEKQKFVYILNRDNQAKLTISSPLEAHKSHSIVFDMIGVDVGFMNPLFATIEMDYTEADADSTGNAAQTAKKSLVWYELDLGLNHVVRKSSDIIDRSSHRLIAVPGGLHDAPGGVLVCAKSCVYYRNNKGVTHKAIIPRRIHTLMTSETGDAEDGTLIIAHTMYEHEKTFWFLLQTEHGDLFHVSLDYQKDDVHGIKLQYFDTVAPAVQLVLTGTFLHVFSEVGNQYMYNVMDVPSPDENVTFEAKDAHPVSHLNGIKTNGTNGSSMEVDENSSDVKLYFKPRALRYLVMADGETPSLSPILDIKVTQPKNEEAPQILALCGSGPRSSLSILRHGIQVEQKAKTAMDHANGIWTLKTKGSMEFDQYIVVSFANSTLILSVGESVHQITEEDPLARSFIDNAATLNIGRLADDTIVQIHSGGIRHIRSELSNQELPCPSDRKVLQSTMNERQVVLALNGATNNLVYYESDGASKLLPPHSFSVGGEILAVALQSVPANRQRARFLAVAVADDKGSKIILYSLDPNELMQTLSVQVLSWRVNSLALLPLQDASTQPSSSAQSSSSHHHTKHQPIASQTTTLTLGVGATNGIFSRFQVDANSGEISDSRDKALGNKPVKLFAVRMPNGGMALGASSSRPWLLFSLQNTLRMIPLAYAAFDHAFTFHSELCQHGIVCTTSGYLAIISPEGYTRTFDHRKVPLSYTPRQSCVHPITGNLLIVESDHNADPIQERERLHTEMTSRNPKPAPGESDILSETLYNCPKPGPKTWGSCVRLVEIESGQTLDLVSLDNNEAAVSITTCSFSEHSGEVFVCVGTAKDLVLQPKRSCSAAFIHVYSLVDKGRKLQLLHKKQVEDIPGALAMYDHRLLAGIGKSLKIYDLGKRNPQLLRKCENNGFPNHIVSISTTRERIIVGDIQESVHFVKYSRPGSLTIFADDTTPRWITSVNALDFDTVAGSDKFGNVFVLRLPEKVTRVESDAGVKASPFSTGSLLGGAAHKLELACCFHVGETVTRVQKIRLTPGGAEFLLYATVFGTIGALLPLTSRSNVDFFSQLELFMRQENPPLCGRDHLAYRSSYFPVKNVVDGDLLEQFGSLHPDKQKIISDHLEQPIADIHRRIEDIRSQL
jgi:splicing factor 3B subunit 3